MKKTVTICDTCKEEVPYTRFEGFPPFIKATPPGLVRLDDDRTQAEYCRPCAISVLRARADEIEAFGR